MKLISIRDNAPPKTARERQQRIDRNIYVIEMTGAELRRIGRLSYAREGGDEFPTDGRIHERVARIEPALDLTLKLTRGKLQ